MLCKVSIEQECIEIKGEISKMKLRFDFDHQLKIFKKKKI